MTLVGKNFEFSSREYSTVFLPAVIQQVFGGSRNDARRTIESGGFRIDGEKHVWLTCAAKDINGKIIQSGKKKFARMRME